MNEPRVLVLGGTGFVGRAFCAEWFSGTVPAPGRLLVPTRYRAHAAHLLTWPGVDVVQANVHDDAALDALLQGVDAVVNLVAILHGTPAQFEQAHVVLPEQPQAAPSHYLRTKAAGEAVLKASASLVVTVLRPSVIFGAHDKFLNLFASMQALAPFVPLAGASARFQPVWVQDVARALVHVLWHPQLQGQVYECAMGTVSGVLTFSI